MSAVVQRLAGISATLDELRNVYDSRVISWCTGHGDVEKYPPGSHGHETAVRRKAAYELAGEARALVEQLEALNDQLIVAARGLRS